MDWNVFSPSAPMSFGRVHGLDLVATQRDQERDRQCASLSATSSASTVSCRRRAVRRRTSTADSGTADGRCRTSTRTPWAPRSAKSWPQPRRCCSAGVPGRRWPPPWPERAGDPFADRMNEIPKYVASRTLSQPDLTWPGSTLLPADDAIGAVRELRARDGEALQVMGSASLAAQLIAHGLVDEYRLMIEPILLGGGKRLFPDDGAARALELVSATTTATGVLICTYRPLTADRALHAVARNGLVAPVALTMLASRSRGPRDGPDYATPKVGHDSRTAHRRSDHRCGCRLGPGRHCRPRELRRRRAGHELRRVARCAVRQLRAVHLRARPRRSGRGVPLHHQPVPGSAVGVSG